MMVAKRWIVIVSIIFLTFARTSFVLAGGTIGPEKSVIDNVHKCVQNEASCLDNQKVKSAWDQAMGEAQTAVNNLYKALTDLFMGAPPPTLPSSKK